MTQDYFQVRLAESLRLALPMTAVEAVLQINSRQIYPVPGLPVWLIGVMNRRGTLTWVMDLSQFLEVKAPLVRSGKDVPAIILTATVASTVPNQEASRRSIACLVGELMGGFTPSTIERFTKPLKPRLKPLFSGVTEQDGRAIALLDPVALLKDVHAQAGTTSEPTAAQMMPVF